ncbi:hypothetical protein LIER_05804 [Lithospermum erythrorhizon]|uniref:TF-B3 domain-containing protein n=1 Tax=Lithospermum erythrorhizon TaxID=34254 RepID=A0AAV3P1V0_LITER
MRNLAHGGACSECTTNCLLVHKNPMYPFNSVDRVFKRISGKDLSEVMFVPSRVAHEKKWRKYTNREACLEDTTGEKYPVKIYEVENAVAFTEGWFEAVSSDSKKSPSSSVVSKPLCGEDTGGKMLHLDHAPLDMDPLYMVNRDAQFVDNRTCLLDLSSFEKLEDHSAAAERRFSTPVPQPYKKENDVIEIEPRISMAVNAGVRSCTHVSKMIVCRDRFGLADNIPTQRDVSISETPSYKAKLDNKKNIDRSGSAYSAQDKRRKVATGGNPNLQFLISSKKTDLISIKKYCTVPISLSISFLPFGSFGTGKAFKTVKKELNTGDELFGHRQRLSEDIFRECSSAVVDDKPYLCCSCAATAVAAAICSIAREKLRIIYLRAPDRKVLPVMYQQRNGAMVLTSGWRVFKSMYRLHAGCRCRIELEDASKRVYGFEVISK